MLSGKAHQNKLHVFIEKLRGNRQEVLDICVCSCNE